MDDLLNKFKLLSAYKILKLLDLEDIIPKLPEFETQPKVKIITLGREYVQFKNSLNEIDKDDSNFLVHYTLKDKEILENKINSSNFDISSFILEESKLIKNSDNFLVIEEIQYNLFKKIQKLVSKECNNLVKLIGKEKTSVLLCELGSLKRLTEIPSKNLKGIGYVNNFILQQPSYLTGIKKDLRKTCNEVSWAAKKDFYNFELEKKKVKKIPKLKKEIKKENKKRGGKKVKEKRKKIYENKLLKEENKIKKEEFFSSPSSDNEI